MVITYVNEYTKLDMKQPVQEKKIWEILETVTDPEIPVLSIIDMGIVRAVQLNNDGELTITITPTYSGCPAMDAISMDIRLKLIEQGYRHVKILSVLSPAWTTDWISAEGRDKLKAYGIAPPIDGTAAFMKGRMPSRRSSPISIIRLAATIPPAAASAAPIA